MNPDHEYILWTEKAIDDFILKEYPELYKFYITITEILTRVDFARLLIIYHFGGVYADLDMECLQPIDSWIVDHTKVNIAHEPPPSHGTPKLGCAIFCTPEKYQPLGDMLNNSIDNFDPTIQHKPGNNMKTFGPDAWMEYYNKIPNQINLVKTSYFFPIPDITLSKDLENQYMEIIKNRQFGDAWAVHYWEHSNWPRKNILVLIK